MSDESRSLVDAEVAPVKAKSKKPRIVLRNELGQLQPGSAPPPRRPGSLGGGQKGNLNAVRNPWAVFWRKRALRSEDKWVLALVRDYVDELVADKGGEENVSFAQRKVMEVAAVSRVCWALAMTYGNLKAVARFISSERAALSDLGLERKAKPMPSLADVMREAAKGEGEK